LNWGLKDKQEIPYFPDAESDIEPETKNTFDEE
jgi:hypothetical protein